MNTAAEALYIPCGGADACFGLLHTPEGQDPPRVGVLMVPPFGWDDISSYRSRRHWALQLTAAGRTVLRIDLPSTGDSPGSPRDPDRLGAWSHGVAVSADLLRERGCEHLVAIGMGLGGLVTVAALQNGAAVDDLVLWAVPARGSRLVRELRAFARLNAINPEPGEAATSPAGESEGALEVNGYLLTGDTVAALEALDLSDLNLSEHPGRRAMVLGRDGISPDRRLIAALSDANVEVTVGDGAGFTEMTNHPEQALPPTVQIDDVDAWIDSPPVGSSPAEALRPRPRGSALSRWDSSEGQVGISEQPLVLELPSGRTVGVLTAPLEDEAAPVMAVLLNAGAVRRIGPSRLWVDLARRWAAAGVATLRVDIEGVGDADGDVAPFREVASFYRPRPIEQVIAVLDALQRGQGASSFLLLGLCSGGYWAFQAALEDSRVQASFLVNSGALWWDDRLLTEREAHRARWIRDRTSWSRVVKGEVPATRIVSILAARARRTPSNLAASRPDIEGLTDRSLERISESGRRLLLAFSAREPLYDELKRNGQLERVSSLPNVELVRLPGADHTLRPVRTQQRTLAILDAALERERDNWPD